MIEDFRRVVHVKLDEIINMELSKELKSFYCRNNLTNQQETMR